jgi:hypothetical protein
MATIEIRRHWPSFDPGSDLLFSGTWKSPREATELPENERRAAAQNVVLIAEKYLRKTTEFPPQSRTHRVLFLFCCYVLLAAQTAIYGIDNGEAIIAPLDSTIQDLGLGKARLSTG